jgi:hypothetical protein
MYEYLLGHVRRLGRIAEHAPAVTKDILAVEIPQDLDDLSIVAGGQRGSSVTGGAAGKVRQRQRATYR